MTATGHPTLEPAQERFMLWALHETRGHIAAAGGFEQTFVHGINAFDYRRSAAHEAEAPTKQQIRVWAANLESMGLMQAPTADGARALVSWDRPVLHQHALCPVALTRDGIVEAARIERRLARTGMLILSTQKDLRSPRQRWADGLRHPVGAALAVALISGCLAACVISLL